MSRFFRFLVGHLPGSLCTMRAARLNSRPGESTAALRAGRSLELRVPPASPRRRGDRHTSRRAVQIGWTLNDKVNTRAREIQKYHRPMAASLLQPVPATLTLRPPSGTGAWPRPVECDALEGLPALTNVRRRRPRDDRLACA
jgi:hypothetical protein